jgi:hypothetical protein
VADSEPAYPTFPVTQGTSRPISQESASSIGSLSKGFPGNDYRYKRKKKDGAYMHTLQNPMNAVADSRHVLCNLRNRPHILVTAVHSRVF